MATADPLAQLADIQQPEIVSFWYERPLWWLAILLLVAVLGVTAWRWYRRYQQQAPQREAIALLDALPNDCDASAITTLLKRYIKSRQPESPLLVAAPSQLQSLFTPPSDGIPLDLTALHYQRSPERAAIEQYRQQVRLWIMQHTEVTPPL